ncbi:MAG: hypothetical protein ACE5H9_10090 [Anaerolineae bacterium]
MKSHRLALLLVLLPAFFFRFYRLADHPLGTFFDPAINGLDAVRLMQRGGHTLFFPTNGGRESLFIYLLIPFIGLFGTTPFSLRLLTAISGLLNVALLFGFLYDWPALASVAGRPAKPAQHRRLWLATLGGLVLAVTYWPIVISRLGQRPVLVPLISVPLFWFFLKGWAGGQKRWFILSGLLMGLEGYTYSAARLLPVILALALLPEFLPGMRQAGSLSYRSRMTHSFVFIAVALAVYLPMAWYLVVHPAQFSERAFSVMIWNFLDTPAGIVAEMGRNLLRVLGFFCCAGSQTPIFGLPGHPGLHPWLAPFLLIGLIGALANWRHLFHRLIALWWLIGVLPSVISIEAPHPLRMIVAVVPTAILIALSPVYLSQFTIHNSKFRARLDFAGKFLHARWLRWLLAAAILGSIPGTYRAYFVEWANLPETSVTYDYEAIAIRDEILARAGEEDAPIYLPLARFNDTPLLFYLSGAFQRQAALTAPPADTAVVIAPDAQRNDTTWVRLQGGSATILPPLTDEGQAVVGSAWVANREIAPGVRLGRLATDPVRYLQRPAQPASASFGPLQLSGASYPAVIGDGPGFPVTLFWRATASMKDEYEIIVHLVDDDRRAWGVGDARPTGWAYPTSFWRPGLDVVAAQHNVVLVSDELAPGRYWLAVSVFDPASGRRLPLTGGQSSAPDTFFIGPLKVPLPPPSTPVEPVITQPATFGETIRLAGFALESDTLAAHEAVRLALLWDALAAPGADYTVFVHLLDSDDNRLAGHDSQPVGGLYPTGIWSPAERIIDRHTLLPVTDQGDPLPPGQYRLAIGLYDPATGERLPVVLPDGRQDPQRRLILGQTVRVKVN